MLGGYAGVIVTIELTDKQITKSEMPDELATKFISGRGLGDKLLYDIIPPKADPLSPENVLILSAGVLAGTASPFSSRSFLVDRKSVV